jgi:3-deoxy-D-manno-octulosonic-acid transferase
MAFIYKAIYNFSIRCYIFGYWCFSFFNEKAAKGWLGRKNTKNTISDKLQNSKEKVWFHVASHGEFDQALPLIQLVQANSKNTQIVISFFSPSGYEYVQKHYPEFVVFYLPFDTTASARLIVEVIQPKIVIFTKKEIWPNLCYELKSKSIPFFLISALFRSKDDYLFKTSLFRDTVNSFEALFVQDAFSQNLAEKYCPLPKIYVTGDSRIDRVLARRAAVNKFENIKGFKGNSKLLIVGSSWPPEEALVRDFLEGKENSHNNLKIIFAPHDLSKKRVNELLERFSEAALYSKDDFISSKILILDTIGMLASIYQYADYAFVGGGFSKKGLHNILEPLAWSVPTTFGPKIKHFPEAVHLQSQNICNSITSGKDLNDFMTYYADEKNKETFQQKLDGFFKTQKGASVKIFSTLKKYL